MSTLQSAIRACVAVIAAAALLPAMADDPPAPAEPFALKVARREAAGWAERVKAATDAAAQAATRLEAATKGVADAKAAQAAAEKALADTIAALTAAEQSKTAAEKALADAQEALKKTEAEKKDDAEAIAAAKRTVETAAKGAEAAAKASTDLAEKKKQTEADKAAADKRVAEAEAGVKPATEAKAALDKAAAELEAQAKPIRERPAALEKGPIKADPAATRLLQTLTHDRPIMSCRYSAEGDYLFAGAQDNNFHRYDVVASSALHVAGHKSWAGTIGLLSPAGTQILTGGHEGKLVWWNALDPSPAPVRSIDAHKGYIRSIAVSPDGQLIATGGNDNLVKVWSAADGSLVKELAGHDRHVYSVAFHPSGKYLISGDLMGILKQWEVGSWSMLRELDAKVLSKFDPGFRADVGGVRSLDFSPDGRHLAAAGITDVSNAFAGIGVPAVVLIDFVSGKPLRVQKPKENIQGSVFSLRFHPSGEFYVAAGGGPAGALWFFKLEDEKSFFDFKLPSVAYDMALHPDGVRLVVGLFDKTLRVYDLGPKLEVAATK